MISIKREAASGVRMAERGKALAVCSRISTPVIQRRIRPNLQRQPVMGDACDNPALKTQPLDRSLDFARVTAYDL